MKNLCKISDDYLNSKLKYLKLLSKQYPSISKASTEIINLEAILNLPKGTEHFITDVHGEYEPFVHVLKKWFWCNKEKNRRIVFKYNKRQRKKNVSNSCILS